MDDSFMSGLDFLGGSQNAIQDMINSSADSSLSATNQTLNEAGIESAIASPRSDTQASSTTSSVTPSFDNSQPSFLDGLIGTLNENFGPSFFGKTIGPTADGKNDFHIADAVGILAGLVLLAGAVFGFRQITTTVVTGVKKGAEVAAT
jgi:hypothetical protein